MLRLTLAAEEIHHNAINTIGDLMSSLQPMGLSIDGWLRSRSVLDRGLGKRVHGYQVIRQSQCSNV